MDMDLVNIFSVLIGTILNPVDKKTVFNIGGTLKIKGASLPSLRFALWSRLFLGIHFLHCSALHMIFSRTTSLEGIFSRVGTS